MSLLEISTCVNQLRHKTLEKEKEKEGCMHIVGGLLHHPFLDKRWDVQ